MKGVEPRKCMTIRTERDTVSSTPGEGYRAVVERYRDEPNRCTIFPSDSDEHERKTTWITAKDPSFVDLRSIR